MFKLTRATTVVNHPVRFSIARASERLSRSQDSCTASSASLSDPSMRYATARSRDRFLSNCSASQSCSLIGLSIPETLNILTKEGHSTRQAPRAGNAADRNGGQQVPECDGNAPGSQVGHLDNPVKRAGQDLILRGAEYPAGQTPQCRERDETLPCSSSQRNPSQGPQEKNERNAESDVQLGQARGIAQPKPDAK